MADYTTPADIKSSQGISDNDDDLRLQAACTAASRQVENHCGRRFWQDSTVVQREFYAECSTFVDLLEQPGLDPKVEISTTTGLIVKADTGCDGTFASTLTISTDFVLLPRNAAADARPYSAIQIVGSTYFPIISNGRAGVQVTARFGWETIPQEVKEAAKLQAIYIAKAKDAPFGAAQFGDGSPLFLRNAPLHPAAKGLLVNLRRAAVG